MFAREGYSIIGGALVLGVVLVGFGWWAGGVLGVLAAVLGVLAVAFTLFFFRDPDRSPPPGASELLLAPADGRVVAVVEDEEEPLYLKGPATRVSIFLSPLNVHVNRAPATGEVEYERYVPGEYLVAWHPKASDKNERSELGLRHDGSGTKVLFKQIAGAVARRIVYHLREGDRIEAGARFGLVKFGSRMDVLVPPSVAVQVEEGTRVRGGESVLGRLPAGGEERADEERAGALQAAFEKSADEKSADEKSADEAAPAAS